MEAKAETLVAEMPKFSDFTFIYIIQSGAFDSISKETTMEFECCTLVMVVSTVNNPVNLIAGSFKSFTDVKFNSDCMA